MARHVLLIVFLLIFQCLSTIPPSLEPQRRLNASELQPLPAPIRCTGCKELVNYHYCESDANGNQDRPVAKCQNGCNFIRLAKRTPSKSPPPAPAPAPTAEGPAAASGICSTPGCRKRNISKYCGNDKCLQCCLGLGGCSGLKSHTVTNPPPPPPPPMDQPTPAASATPVVPSTLTTGTQVANSNPAPVPATKARHASHMLPSFTTQLETQRSLAEDKRKNDEERILSEKRLEHLVIVYSWTISNAVAKSRIYQAGGNGPYFIATKDVFSDIGLREALEEGKVELYFEELGLWTHVGIDYTLALKHKQHHLYLRHEDATITLGLDDYLKIARTSSAHVRENLPPEQAHSREVYKQKMPTAPRAILPAASQPGPSKARQPVAPAAGPSKPQQPVPLAGPSKRRHVSPPLSPKADLTLNVKCSDSPHQPRARPLPKKIKVEAKPVPRSFSPVDLVNEPSSPPGSSYSPPPSPGPSSHLHGGHSTADAIEIDSDTEISNWPKHYAVYKIAACLRELKSAPRATPNNGHPTHATIFNRYFPDATYRKSTVNNQAKRLCGTPAHLKKEAIDAKDEHLGKWSTFQQNVTLWKKAGSIIPTTTPTMVSAVIDLTDL